MNAEQDDVREFIMLSVFEVFEKMYYIFLEPRDDEPSDEEKLFVQIRFSGDWHGEIQAYYSEVLARAMIENALGLDKEDVTEQILEDCLKESLNMICGSFLQKYEQEKVLQLSIPRYRGATSTPRPGDIGEGVWISFEGSGSMMDVIVRFDKTTD